MTILNIIGVAFAAFCVWLAVRIFNRRERWAKWMVMAVAIALVLYPLSFGPACWLSDRNIIPYRSTYVFFAPLIRGAFHRDRAVAPLLNWFADVGARREGAARRIFCKGYAGEIGCGSIDGCDEDDFQP